MNSKDSIIRIDSLCISKKRILKAYTSIHDIAKLANNSENYDRIQSLKVPKLDKERKQIQYNKGITENVRTETENKEIRSKTDLNKEEFVEVNLYGILDIDQLIQLSKLEASACSKLVHLDLSHNSIIGTSKQNLNYLIEALPKCKFLELINLNDCGVVNHEAVKVIRACRKLYYLCYVFLKDSFYETNLNEFIDQTSKDLLEELKQNVSIIKLDIISEDQMRSECPEIIQELKENDEISFHKSQLIEIDSSISIPVSIKHIKLCIRFKIQLVLEEKSLSQEYLKMLEDYFMRDNKICVINFENISSSNIRKVIRLLDKPKLNITHLDVINFGYKIMNKVDFIIFGKWLINKFSDKRDNDDIKLGKLLFSCSNYSSILESLNKENTKHNCGFEGWDNRINRRAFYKTMKSTTTLLDSTVDTRVEIILKFLFI